MTRGFLISLVCLVLGGPLLLLAHSNENDLSNGVLIVHHEPDIALRADPPPEGWCEAYVQSVPITTCEEQHPAIPDDPLGREVVWYVIAAWDEEKVWCAVDFGFGGYNAGIFAFTDWGPCFPVDGLEIPTANWPGPNEGTVFVVIGEDHWQGNFVPVYFFAGYAYPAGSIPLDVDPQTAEAIFGNCVIPQPELFDIQCLGAMGILMQGEECCPEGPTPNQEKTWGSIKELYR